MGHYMTQLIVSTHHALAGSLCTYAEYWCGDVITHH